MEHMRISELRNEPLGALSAGQRQRVFVAQAFARGAELLVLDEPDAGLDWRARGIYRKVLRDAADAGCSAVVATHDIEEAACSDFAMLLAQQAAKRLVAFGRASEVLTAEALLSTFGLVARYGKGGGLVFEHHRYGDFNGHHTDSTEFG
jgi:ABC-type Mn2+/Zn2+ transport system ATPase subunit